MHIWGEGRRAVPAVPAVPAQAVPGRRRTPAPAVSGRPLPYLFSMCATLPMLMVMVPSAPVAKSR